MSDYTPTTEAVESLGEDIQAYLVMDGVYLDHEITRNVARCILSDPDWAGVVAEEPEWEYRVQHPVYTDGLKDWAGWTKYRHLAEEGARRWGEESWIERRRTGPIERVPAKQEGAHDV